MDSQFDDIYFRLFGEKPNKSGAAYEKLSAAIRKLRDEGSQVFHDQFISGAISQTTYQVDVHHLADETITFGEVKDYTERNAKVGRPDIQKLAGALPDLPVTDGAVYSATGYTKPAIKYAASARDIVGKPIDLYDLRIVESSDLENRIKEIHFRAHILFPRLDTLTFKSILTQEGRKKLHEIAPLESKIMIDGIFYTANGEVSTSIQDLYNLGIGNNGPGEFEASWILTGLYVKAKNQLLPVHGATYKITVEEEVRDMVIRATGEPTLILKNLDGSIDEIYRDHELKRAHFSEGGEVRLAPRNMDNYRDPL